jgi:hypothetical protein
MFSSGHALNQSYRGLQSSAASPLAFARVRVGPRIDLQFRFPLTSILSPSEGRGGWLRLPECVNVPDEAKIFRVATFYFPVFHHPHETFFDLTRFRRVTRYDGAGRDEF